MGTKIATCCYCGTRAVLRFDRARHELACSACAAPLHEMKAMPLPARPFGVKPAPKAAAPMRLKRRDREDEDRGRYRHHRKGHRRKGWARWAAEELWDVVEDIFD